MTKQRIAIIGAGITGLVAAYKLCKNKNYQITIFEKTNGLGGLAENFKIEGENIEKSYHHIFKTDKYIINLAKELGIQNKLRWENSSLAIYYQNQLFPFVKPLDLLKFKPLNIIDKFRLGASILYLQKTNNWKKFINITAEKWLKKHCGEKAYEIIWLPLLKGKFHKSYQNISMAWLWARIHTRGNSKDKGKSKEKLGYFYGGLQVVIDAILKVLKIKNVKIKSNCHIKKILSEDNKIKIVLSDNSSNVFDKVICTISSKIFSELIKSDAKATNKYLTQLKSINYLGAICVVFSSKQSLSKYYWHNINNIDLPFLVFIQHTNLIDKSNYRNKHIYYIGTYLPHDHKFFKQKDAQIFQTFFKHLKDIFPTFKKTKISQKFLFKLPYAQHVVDRNYDKKIPNYKTPIPNLFLANFSQIFPEDRGVNFAVREGIKIANLIK